MSMPLVRSALLSAAIMLVSAALPPVVGLASNQLSAQLLAGRGVQGTVVPYGFPQRQDGSALRILGVSSTPAHVCGVFDLQNTSTIPVERVRFVGILSFKPAARRPVQIVESDWVSQPLAPGATARVNAGLVDVDLAWREARGEHVQAFCAVRQIVYANGVTWGVTPNANVVHGNEALDQSRPTLPRAFVGQTHALATSGATLCLDEKGAEYSGGAQIDIRDEPGKAARCSVEGQWVEVDARTGEPLADVERQVVSVEVAVDGLPSTIALKSAAGAVATVQLAGGRTWGLVPTVAANGDVSIAVHDMSNTPHRLVGSRSLQPGEAARFGEASRGISVRLASR